MYVSGTKIEELKISLLSFIIIITKWKYGVIAEIQE